MLAELSLIRLAKTGCRKSADRLIRMHTGFLYSMVVKKSIPGYDREDLFQLAAIGLVESISTFDESLGFKFLTHASWQIRKQLNIALRDVTRQKRFSSCVVSLDAPAAVDSNTPLVEMLESPATTDEYSLLQDAKKSVSSIPNSKHRQFATAFLETFTTDEETTLRTIGEKFGKSRERIRQVRVLLKKYKSMRQLHDRIAA